MKLYALMVWVHDTPVTGSVLSLSNIVEPRKELCQYAVGDLVTIRLSGFGTPKGIIGKIEDETKKEELKDILSDDIEFKRIVENCSKDSGKSGEIEPTQSKKAKTDDQNVTPLPKSKKLMGNANTDEKRKDAKSQNGRAKKLKANPKVNLERAAEAQRLFELDTETDAIESLDPLLDADTVPATRDPQPVPPQEPETEHVPPQEPETEHVPPTETVSCSASVGEALNVLNPQPVPEPEHCHLNLHSPSLEQRVIWLESQLGLAWQSIYELQRTVSWLSQPGNQLQIPHTLSQNLTGSNGFVEENELDIGEQISPKENSPGQFGSTSDQVYNNYTKDQLWSYVQNAEEFGKASKLLFRKLFSEEEYRGRSLTGSAANKSTPARPALQDQRKLKVIHELIQKRWTWAKPAMVNGKISEILKPSRNSGQFRK